MVWAQTPLGWILMVLELPPPHTVPLLMVWPFPSCRGWMVQSSAVPMVGEMTSTCLLAPPSPPTMRRAG